MAQAILDMVDREQRARIDARLVPIKAEATALLVATFGVTYLPWLLILAAVGLALAGMETAAWITGAVALLGGGAQTIHATRRPKPPPRDTSRA